MLGAPELVAWEHAPLSRELVVETDVPTTLTLHLRGPGVDTSARFPTPATRHVVPVLGAHPAGDHVVDVELETARGGTAVVSASFSTPPLPADFPVVTVRAVDVDAVQTGVVFAALQTPFGRHWLVALDPRDGEVVWSYTGPEDFGDLDVTPRGTVLGLSEGGFLEVDRMGRRVLRARPATLPGEPDDLLLDAAGFTHELAETPGGYLTLVSRRVAVDAYPRSYDEPELLGGPAELLTQDVVSLAADGAVTARWSLFDALDPERIGFDSLDVVGGAFDWAHANAVLPDERGVIVSLRHQDALVALDAAGSLRWILSNPYGWSAETAASLLDGPTPDGWPLHQHGPAFDLDGNLMWFDNGNEGRSPYAEPPGRPLASRVTAVSIDEDARTAETAWVWEPADVDLYSPALGNVAPLPGGHVLADYGFVSAVNGEDNVSAGRPMRSVRLFELDPSSAAPIFDLAIDTDPSTHPDGVKLYRALPAASLYPPGVEVVSRSTP